MLTNSPVRHAEADEKGLISVAIADMVVTQDQSATLITHALGSCIGVTIYDPVAKVAGMIHFMLPDSKTNAQKAADKPGMFGDIGVPMLFKAAYDLGAKKERMIVCAAGGAEVMSADTQFRIGARNRTLIRKLFWKNNILLAADETGGDISRTMVLRMTDGTVSIRNKGTERQLWPL